LQLLIQFSGAKKNMKNDSMLNSYLYAAPYVVEQLTQGETKTRAEYEARAAAAIEAFAQAFSKK
jgi:hypothetical protein